MSGSRRFTLLAAAAVLISSIAFFVIMNVRVSITCGVNGVYKKVEMPLYAKITGFLARHFEYERIAREISGRSGEGTPRALAIFAWTHEHVRPTPAGMPDIDDHVLNIIIRGYGTSEQSQDVFTTLCVYAGMPAYWQRVYDDTGKVRYSLSFVFVDGEWRVFDPYFGKYLVSKDGRIASVRDLIQDKRLADREALGSINVSGVPYKQFYKNIGAVSRPHFLRAEKQMPIKRIYDEVVKALRLEKEAKTR